MSKEIAIFVKSLDAAGDLHRYFLLKIFEFMNIKNVSTLFVAALAAISLNSACLTKKSVESRPIAEPVANIAKDYSALVPGEWTIYKVGGKSLTGDERPYLTFDASNSRFYGSNGCNTINGDYSLGGAVLSFSNVISTMRACEDAPFEYAINQAVDKVRAYSVERKGHEYYMSLIGGDGKTLMVLRKHNMDFLNGAWQVTRLNGEAVELEADESMQLVIDIPEMKLHGNTGCNILNGNLLVDPDKTNAIQFHDVTTTRMACRDPKRETAFLLALEAVDAAAAKGDGVVELFDDNGKSLMVLSRIDNKQ